MNESINKSAQNTGAQNAPTLPVTEQPTAQVQPIAPPQVLSIAQLSGFWVTINLFLAWLIAKEVNKAIAKLTETGEK